MSTQWWSRGMGDWQVFALILKLLTYLNLKIVWYWLARCTSCHLNSIHALRKSNNIIFDDTILLVYSYNWSQNYLRIVLRFITGKRISISTTILTFSLVKYYCCQKQQPKNELIFELMASFHSNFRVGLADVVLILWKAQSINRTPRNTPLSHITLHLFAIVIFLARVKSNFNAIIVEFQMLRIIFELLSFYTMCHTDTFPPFPPLTHVE